MVPLNFRHSGARSSREPSTGLLWIPGPLALLVPRNDERIYRTNSFIALSSPSIVIGYMRCENSRRMMVVDSE